MKSSRYYQTVAQIVGSGSDIVLFCSGFFLGKEMFAIALSLMLLRLISKVVMSELMYKRMKAIIKEDSKCKTDV